MTRKILITKAQLSRDAVAARERVGDGEQKSSSGHTGPLAHHEPRSEILDIHSSLSGPNAHIGEGFVAAEFALQPVEVSKEREPTREVALLQSLSWNPAEPFTGLENALPKTGGFGGYLSLHLEYAAALRKAAAQEAKPLQPAEPPAAQTEPPSKPSPEGPPIEAAFAAFWVPWRPWVPWWNPASWNDRRVFFCDLALAEYDVFVNAAHGVRDLVKLKAPKTALQWAATPHLEPSPPHARSCARVKVRSAASAARTCQGEKALSAGRVFLLSRPCRAPSPAEDKRQRGLLNQTFAYEWDEVGRLVRARRWDGTAALTVDSPLPSGAPAADLRSIYDAGDQRVIKEAVDGSNNKSYTLYVFDTLELRRAPYGAAFAETPGQSDYEASSWTVVPYLLANGVRIGRVAYEEPAVPSMPAGGTSPGAVSSPSGQLHVFFELGDHLGSTSVVLDKATGELVERATFQAYGASESDYRPDRWKNFREDYRFTGKEEDVEVGLQYFGFRFLNPLLGRWMSADPLAVHSPGEADLNLYAYVSGAVLKNVDPLGLEEEEAQARKNIEKLESQLATNEAAIRRFDQELADLSVREQKEGRSSEELERAKGELRRELDAAWKDLAEKWKALNAEKAYLHRLTTSDSDVQATFERDSGRLVVEDIRKRTKVETKAFSGGTYEGVEHKPVPAGRYEILERGREKWYRLDAKDSSPRDDATPDTENGGPERTGIRMHLGRYSFGCVTVNLKDEESVAAYERIVSMIESAERTVQVEDNADRFGRDVTKYGELQVR